MHRVTKRLFTVIVVGSIAAWCMAVEPTQVTNDDAGRFSTVKIEKGAGLPYAFEVKLDGKGKAVGLFSPESKDPRTYFNDAGMLYTNGWIIISGVYTGTGEGYNIEPPSKDTSMLAIWSDVLGPAVQVRAANAGPESYLFQGMDRRANYTFSIEQDGELRWGAGSRTEMDANLYRSGPSTLKTDGSLAVTGKVGVGGSAPTSTLHVDGSQSVKRKAVAADYVITDADYYIGISDTGAQRTIALPSAAGTDGRVYIIKDESGGAASHGITVKAAASETIDGAAEQAIKTNFGVLKVISSGSGWFLM